MELWECEAEDDGEGGRGDIAEEEWPEAWYAPVAATADYRVKVPTDLIALSPKLALS